MIGNAQLAAAGDPTVVGERARSSGSAPGTGGSKDGAAQAAAETPAAGTAAEAEPPPSLEELLAELDALVGLEAVKTEVRHQTQLLRIQALRGRRGCATPT